MFFAIRDDDTCFFTKPDELSSAYDFVDNGTISLSCVPYCFPYHKDANPFKTDFELGYYDISNNPELIKFLKAGIESERFEIMLHGYSHEYKRINGSYQAEMIWKSKSQLDEELTLGKKHLEEIFDVKIETFVAPNNLINKYCVSVLENLGLNYSGTIWKHFGDRKCDRYYIRNYLHRTFYYLRHKMPYSGVYRYKQHLELYAHSIRNEQDAMRIYNRCKKDNLPFVIYNHYWDLNSNPKKKEMIKRIYNYIISDGCRLVPLSECFKQVSALKQ